MIRHAPRAATRPGFTMIELLMVVAIIGILAGLLLPALARARQSTRVASAKNAMQAIAMSLEKYREDFRVYPPDDEFGNGDEASSLVLGKYLCSRHTWGEMHYGPYLENVEGRLRDVGAGTTRALVSPLGGFYQYKELEDPEEPADSGKKRKTRYTVVDAGPDKKWGGTIDVVAGFIVDGTDQNNDGTSDDKDNIYSSMQTGL
jgi:prepilin-type N-terminal cleavage/methylation domain-containing protein